MREDPPPVPNEEGVEGGGGAEGRGLGEGNPPQQMVEVTEEVGGDEYQYEDEEFEVRVKETFYLHVLVCKVPG